MSTSKSLPRLTEAQIRELASPQSFERGDRYYRNGTIINPTRQGMELWASCQGSEQYEPRATLGKGGIVASSCTCPYDWGGLCKHQVALLLTYVRQPGAFDEVPPLAELLAARSREDLVVLVQRMVQRYPDLLALVELSAPRRSGDRLDLSTYKRQVKRALQKDDMDDIAEALRVVADGAVQLLDAGDWLNAGGLYQLLLEEITAAYDSVMNEIDYDGEICIVVQDAAEGLGLCLAKAPTSEVALRLEWLLALLEAEFKDLELGGIDFAAGATDAIVEQATEEEWAELETRIRQEIQRSDRWRRESLVDLLAARQEQLQQEAAADAIIHELGTDEQRAFLFIKEGKFEEALAIAKDFSHLPGLVTQIADALVEAGVPDRALQYITEQSTQNSRLNYQDWIAKFYEEQGNSEGALAAHLKLFETSPSLPQFLRLQQIAQQLDTWKNVREQILNQLEQSQNFALLIDIALQEQDGDRALSLLKRSTDWSRVTYRQRVAQAVEKTQPQEAIALYKPLVDQAISGRNRDNYRIAAQYMKRMQGLYAALRSPADWQAYVKQIRAQHPTLRALQDEMNKAGL